MEEKETVIQETNDATAKAEAKTFSQDELNAIVKDRLDRERAKYAGFDDFKAKAEKYDQMEEANKTELQRATERAEKLESELNALKTAEAIRTIKDKVAQETGVPASLLTGQTEDECKEQAQSILAFAKPSEYPRLNDGGEIQNKPSGSTRQSFADWANRAFG